MQQPPPDHNPELKPLAAWASCLALVAITTVGDLASGPYMVFDLFYLVPVLGAARWIGRTPAFGFAAVCAALAVGVQVITGHALRGHALLAWAGTMKFGVWAVAVWLVSDRQRQLERQAALISELRGAVMEIKQLKGLLPVCAWCKRLRTEDGSWLRLEEYLHERTDASVTHCICPECARATVGKR